MPYSPITIGIGVFTSSPLVITMHNTFSTGHVIVILFVEIKKT